MPIYTRNAHSIAASAARLSIGIDGDVLQAAIDLANATESFACDYDEARKSQTGPLHNRRIETAKASAAHVVRCEMALRAACRRCAEDVGA